MTTLDVAQLAWQTDDTGQLLPVSLAFDDVYFSKTGGLDESNYVFLSGNHLPIRFKNLKENQKFTIIETGFGTGLNFLATCLLWSSLAPKNARLYFVSTEKFPLTHADLLLALQTWQDTSLKFWADKLICLYPLLIAGCHRLEFGQITLDLWFGDAKESFTQINGQADAWFLDGFAPSKNNELWSDEIFNQIKRLSKSGTTLATFTSAGFVKRALLNIGMTVQKIKGFGRKREMLTAHFGDYCCFDAHKLSTSSQTIKTATVIGAGISGLLTSYALARRGICVTLLDKTSPLAGASGNPKALFAPKITLLKDVKDHLPTVSFLYSQRFYQTLNQLADAEIFSQTGVIDFLLPHKKTHQTLKNLIDDYPNELICQTDDTINQQIPDALKHTISAWIEKAGLIDTKKLSDFILSHPLINFKKFHAVTIAETSQIVEVMDDFDNKICSDIAIICSGFESYLLDSQLFNPRKIRGQISYIQKTNLPNELKTPIKYDGYCAAFDDILLMGASFIRNNTNTDVSLSEHEFNLNKFNENIPTIAKQLNLKTCDLKGRASIRAQTPDYHPIIGQLFGKKRVFALYGMGSKGFSFAPLCSEILAGLIFNEPLCISQNLLDKLSIHRKRLQTPINQNN